MPARLPGVAFWLGSWSTVFMVTNVVVMENGRDLSNSVQRILFYVYMVSSFETEM